MSRAAQFQPVFKTFAGVVREAPIGFAQVMLQPSQAVGLVFIAGIIWNSWILSIFAAAGCFAGIVTSHVLKFPANERRDGLYGFNGTLVGLGCAYFYEPTWLIMVFVFTGGCISAGVMHAMLRRNLKPLTFPFVITTWGLFAVLQTAGWGTPAAPGAAAFADHIEILESLARGIGQVFFQESVFTGVLLIAAVTVRSRIQGLFAGAAAAAGLAAGYVFVFPADAVSLGLFGYNGVLCGVLFAGRKIQNIACAAAAVLLSIFFVRLFHMADLPPFTFPFVLSSWIILWIQSRYFENG